MITDNLSPLELQMRRSVAEKAKPGCWKISESESNAIFTNEAYLGSAGERVFQVGYYEKAKEVACHIAFSSPDAVIAMIDEIERLRKENAALVAANAALLAEKEKAHG